MPGPVFRAGETVDLHTIELEDATFLQRLVNDPRVRGGVAAYEPLNAVQEREWIESLGEVDGVRLLPCVDGEPVGSIGMHDVHEVWGRAKIGYMIDPDHWNRGYATEAVSLLCGHAFEERRLNRLQAGVFETNRASQRVLEKLGFTHEGTRRQGAFVDGEYVDLRVYGLLAEEFEG